jgi:hypothetical protein
MPMYFSLVLMSKYFVDASLWTNKSKKYINEIELGIPTTEEKNPKKLTGLTSCIVEVFALYQYPPPFHRSPTSLHMVQNTNVFVTAGLSIALILQGLHVSGKFCGRR